VSQRETRLALRWNSRLITPMGRTSPRPIFWIALAIVLLLVAIFSYEATKTSPSRWVAWVQSWAAPSSDSASQQPKPAPVPLAAGQPLPSSFPYEASSQSTAGIPSRWVSFEQAVGTCWPDRLSYVRKSSDQRFDTADVERVFGPSRQKTLLEKTDVYRSSDGREQHLTSSATEPAIQLETDEDGLPVPAIEETHDSPSDSRELVQSVRLYSILLGESPNPPTQERDGRSFRWPDAVSVGQIKEINGRIEQLQIRSAGRMLECSAFNQCECL